MLLSILVTVMYSSFHTMGRIMRRNEMTKGAYQTARLIMARMRQDIGCAYFSPRRQNFIFRGEDIHEGENDGDVVTFVTTAHVISRKDAPEGDLAEVSYYLDERNAGILVRREDVSPDDELETGGVLQILGKNVVELNLTYLDGTEEPARTTGQTTSEQDQTQEEKKAWKEEWDSEETPYLPRAVKIDLSVRNDEGQIEDFSSTVVLAMGRTATSIQPTEQAAPGSQGAPGGPGGRGPGVPGGPQLERRGRRGEGRGERGDFTPETGGRGGQRPGQGTPGRQGYDSGVSSPSRPTIRRNTSGAGTGVQPPTPGGRR